MNQRLSIKTVVAIGIGSAIFVVLSRFASIPIGIPSTNLETSYVVLALIAILYGPLAGLVIGFSSKKLNIEEGQFGKREVIFFNLAQVLANIIGWFVVAPTLDVFIYAEPMDKVYLQGLVAGSLNMITIGVLGSLLVAAYAKTRTKKGSLQVE